MKKIIVKLLALVCIIVGGLAQFIGYEPRQSLTPGNALAEC